jgi:hypothetical protein
LAKRAKDRREKEEVLHGSVWPYLPPANNNKQDNYKFNLDSNLTILDQT